MSAYPTDSSMCDDRSVANWGTSTYGNPCCECGFAWTTPIDVGTALVLDVVNSIKEQVASSTGNERHPQLGWSVRAYVCHVGDNLRIWAERLAGVLDGGAVQVHGYDEQKLARARHYDGISLEAALLALSRAVGDWYDVVARSPRSGVVMVHSERGELTLSDVVALNAHDCLHHYWDIETILGRAER